MIVQDKLTAWNGCYVVRTREVREACWIFLIRCASLHLFCFIGGDYGYMCIFLKKVMKIPKFEWDKILKQGIMTVLFVSLLYYVMNSNDQREKRYQDTIKSLTDVVNVNLLELKAMHQSRT